MNAICAMGSLMNLNKYYYHILAIERTGTHEMWPIWAEGTLVWIRFRFVHQRVSPSSKYHIILIEQHFNSVAVSPTHYGFIKQVKLSNFCPNIHISFQSLSNYRESQTCRQLNPFNPLLCYSTVDFPFSFIDRLKIEALSHFQSSNK